MIGQFKLHYLGESPFEIGDPVTSPVSDGLGATTHFIGIGYVSEIETSGIFMPDITANPIEVTVTVTTYYELPWEHERL